MILSFDGNTYLGKTSVIHALKKRFPESVVREEYDTDPGFLEGRTHLEKQKYYFDLERKRQVEEGEKRLVLLDRSYLSILAHSYAVSRIERKNRLGETVGLLKLQRGKGWIIRQQAAVFFIQPTGDGVYSDIDQKGGEAILYNRQYRSYIDDFYLEILRMLSKEAISDQWCLNRIYLWKESRDRSLERLIRWMERYRYSEKISDACEGEDLFPVFLSAVEKILYKVGKQYD
mgnify:CR=1 FL=1